VSTDPETAVTGMLEPLPGELPGQEPLPLPGVPGPAPDGRDDPSRPDGSEEPYDHLLDGNCGCEACCRRGGMPVGAAGNEPASAPLPASYSWASWLDLYERSEADAATARAAADRAMAEAGRDHQAALDRSVQRPEAGQERSPGDGGQPFDVAAGSFLAAASCPSCGYGLGGRACVHVLSGRGAQRTAVAVHQGCAGEVP
jgi:hypothetical protein